MSELLLLTLSTHTHTDTNTKKGGEKEAKEKGKRPDRLQQAAAGERKKRNPELTIADQKRKGAANESY